MKPNKVTMKNAQQDLVSHGKNSIYLAAGKWSVKEESDLHVCLSLANFFSQHGWKKHQMVIVNPHEVTVLNFFCNNFGEEPVRFLICVPCRLIESNLSGVIVEQGPQDGV
jgi:hypothetical protein